MLGSDILQNVNTFNYLGTTICSRDNLLSDHIKDRIKHAYKKVWLIKSLGSMKIQVNPLNFSKGYWASVVPKVCYGIFLYNLKPKILLCLDQFHVNVARNVQGLSNNTPMAVALSSIQWVRLSSHIYREVLAVVGSIMKLPAISLYKRVFVAKLLEYKYCGGNENERGPVAFMYNVCFKFEITDSVFEMIEKGKNFENWKKIVKQRVYNREEKEIKATLMMYKELGDFKNSSINLMNGFVWWLIAKRDVNQLYKVKVMLKALVTNNEKCGFRCECDEKPNIVHILFKCKDINDVRREHLDRLLSIMPNNLRNDFLDIDEKRKVALIYSGFGNFVVEWWNVYIGILDFVYNSLKDWYNSR